MSFFKNRVLSIQSHVVSGYVGNKSATFPLQVLGFEVDAINSVQFSNHTGYKTFRGDVLESQELENIYQGLKENDLNFYSHVLTGYIGSVSFLRKVCDVIKDLKQVNPNIIYVCDPVMGDNGEMYVPKELLPIYQEEVLPLADIVTPNQFEAEWLTGIKINDQKSALQSMDHLHSKGIDTVVISSYQTGPDDDLILLGSEIRDSEKIKFNMQMPKIPFTFTGTGDLFAALLLAYHDMKSDSSNLKSACETTISTMQHILKYTYEEAIKHSKDGQLPVATRELKLIQCKKIIENPEIIFEATVL